MEMWNSEISRRAAASAEGDAFYQELLQECEEKEAVYKKITAILPEERRELIEGYIAICEDLEYRMTQLAYELGLGDGRKK